MTFNQQSPIILELNWTFLSGCSWVSLPKNGYDVQLDRCLQLNKHGGIKSKALLLILIVLKGSAVVRLSLCYNSDSAGGRNSSRELGLKLRILESHIG